MRGRLAATAAIAGLLVGAAAPFVVLFPDPPAFGPESLLLAAVFATLATLATAWRADRAGQRRILRRTGILFGVTAATTASSMALRGGVPLIPTLDLLPALFGLRGEDIDAAIRFEAWCEIWLGWALAGALLARFLLRRPAPPSGASDVPAGRRLGTRPRSCSGSWAGAPWPAPWSRGTGRRHSWPAPSGPRA